MKEVLTIPGMPMCLTCSVLVVGIVVMTAMVLFRDKITSIFMSRTGVEVRMNDVAVWCEFTDAIKRIDSAGQNAIARSTIELEIVDPELYDMSDSAMLVNYKANQPLICATYANDHARKIAADCGNAYLADKTNDVAKAIKPHKNKLPGLTYDLADAHVCHWFKEIVIPHVRNTCLEKIELYTKLINDSKVNRSLKEIFEDRLRRNNGYIECIDHCNKREDITVKSSIFRKESTLC